jgi:hypothetical protein
MSEHFDRTILGTLSGPGAWLELAKVTFDLGASDVVQLAYRIWVVCLLVLVSVDGRLCREEGSS